MLKLFPDDRAARRNLDALGQTFHQSPFATVTRRDSHVTGWSGLIDRQQAYFEAAAGRDG